MPTLLSFHNRLAYESQMILSSKRPFQGPIDFSSYLVNHAAMKKLFMNVSIELQCLWIRLFGPSLRTLFENHQGHLVYKWDHYIEIYEKYFRKYRGRKLVLVEIGVYQGGSIDLWRRYLGPKAVIYGLDINPRCKQFEDVNTHIILGDQADPEFWRKALPNIPKIDIFIDDGGHHMTQQIVTFTEAYPYLSDGGVYICEDLHTSYWEAYAGGLRRSGTFIEFAKSHADQLNAWHSQSDQFKIDYITENTEAISFYDSIAVYEKRKRKPPIARKIGTAVFPD